MKDDHPKVSPEFRQAARHLSREERITELAAMRLLLEKRKVAEAAGAADELDKLVGQLAAREQSCQAKIDQVVAATDKHKRAGVVGRLSLLTAAELDAEPIPPAEPPKA